MTYVMGIDGGTESLRADIFDLCGRCVASVKTPYETHFPFPGYAEQNPEDWWKALGQSVSSAVAKAGLAGAEIDAIGIDTTSCSVVALDDHGRPLRPAIIWMDVRAVREAEFILATGDPALVVNGGGSGPISAEWMLPKALWLKRHQPDLFDRAATICEYQDYLNLRLTGRRVASLDNVSIRWHYSTARGGRPGTLLKATGLDALNQKWPNEVLAPGQIVGTLTKEAARHTGLPESVKVVQGGADAFIGMIGLDVARPGQMALITGSSHLCLGVTDRRVHAPGIWGTYSDAVYPGLEIAEGGQTSTGSILAWLSRLSHNSLDLNELDVEAEKIAPGSEGLLVLDHFQGNRTPYTDALSRGAIVGLSLSHGPAHILRAIMEGVGFGTRAILDAMQNAGIAVKELVACGGCIRSDLWLQIHADTAGLPISVPRFTDAPPLGSAILAAVGAGRFGSINEGIEAMVSIARRVEPRPDAQRRYAEIYPHYLALYPALKPFRPAAQP